MKAAHVLPLLVLPAMLHGQDLAEGKQLYDVQCQACHGEDAHGSDRAPELSGSRRLRSRSTPQIREIIRKGIPEGGMPPFDLPSAKLDALAALIRSLNSPAAENPLPGDTANGEQFFFG